MCYGSHEQQFVWKRNAFSTKSNAEDDHRCFSKLTYMQRRHLLSRAGVGCAISYSILRSE